MSDNTSNKSSAFIAAFPTPEHLTNDATNNCFDDADDHLFLDLSCLKAKIEETIDHCSMPRLSCFTHRLSSCAEGRSSGSNVAVFRQC